MKVFATANYSGHEFEFRVTIKADGPSSLGPTFHYTSPVYKMYFVVTDTLHLWLIIQFTNNC